MIRVVVIDDHAVIIQGIEWLLASEQDMEFVGGMSDSREGLRLIEQEKPDIAVMDITMPGLNGLDAARQIRTVAPKTKTILLTMHNEKPYVVEALKVGVRGYVLKSQAGGDLLRAIRDVSQDQVYLSPCISRVVVEAYQSKHAPAECRLTSREREVLQLVAEGCKTKQAAARLGISIKTAESHRTRIMNKLDIHETAGLVRYAIRHGMISP
ncbi:MAG TPA: response regulator transcription factor [Gammaproteobacteria bacterium]|nr:response regulator transcription factor [Gammaproteobacteria bacterium]